MTFAPSLKLTLPVGAVPLIVAVKVMLAPVLDGLAELASNVSLSVDLPVEAKPLEPVKPADKKVKVQK